MHDFVTPGIGHLENTGQGVTYVFQMLIYFITSHPQLLCIPMMSNTIDLTRKVSAYWEAIKLTVMVQVFQISNFCLRAQILSLATIQSVVFLGVSGSLHCQENLCQRVKSE